jgi:hypothetical protein
VTPPMPSSAAVMMTTILPGRPGVDIRSKGHSFLVARRGVWHSAAPALVHGRTARQGQARWLRTTQ